jgi:hypothetical protein
MTILWISICGRTGTETRKLEDFEVWKRRLLTAIDCLYQEIC